MDDRDRVPAEGIRVDYDKSRDKTDSTGSFSRWVRLGDIMPSAANPRQKFEHIDALANAIKATGGEPINPIVVVKDANRYRIVDGERRFRAMQTLYGDDHETHVLVFNDYSDAAEIVAMLATDSKDSLSEDERAMGYQLAFVLDVPYGKISELSGYPEEVVRKADAWRRGYEGNIPMDIPLDLMVGIAEAGIDAEAAERVLDSDPNQRSWRLNVERRDAMWARNRAEATEWLDGSGLEWVTDEEFGKRRDYDASTIVLWSAPLADVKARHFDEEPDADSLVLILEESGSITVRKLRVEGESEEDRARAEAWAANELVVRAMRDLMAHVLKDLEGFEGTWVPNSPSAEPPSDLCANLSVLVDGDLRGTPGWYPDFAEDLSGEIEAVFARGEIDSREFVGWLVSNLNRTPYWGYEAKLDERDARFLMRVTCAAIDGGHEFDSAYLDLTDALAVELGYDGDDWRDPVRDEG